MVKKNSRARAQWYGWKKWKITSYEAYLRCVYSIQRALSVAKKQLDENVDR